ncbi:ribonuclease Z [Deferribacter thermophilus]|uniref:ribonuclease Z n=1 Tax=Deferribacter thermophilus TaxID=53573 RepID=UPI003C1346E3
MAKLTVLGSGSVVQYEGRGSASYLLEIDDKKIVLDCGFYLLERLEQKGVMADEIDYIFVSHKHPDHFMGLIHFLFARKNKRAYSDKPVTIFGFKGLKEYIESFKNILGKWIEPDIEIHIIENEERDFGIFSYKLFKTKHTDESVGIVLNFDDKKLVYTSDTEYFEGLIEIVNNADLLIAECGKLKGEDFEVHMSYDEVLEIAVNSNISTLLFSHFYPETDKFYIDAKDYNFKIFKARDLMTLNI